MTALNGKWKLVSTNNLEEFYSAIKASDEYKEKLRQLQAARKANPDILWAEFHVDPKAGTIGRTVYIDNEKKKEVNYKFGIVNDGTSEDGRPVKITLGLVGDNKVTIHEKGSDFEVDGFIEAKGKELTLSLSSQGVSSTQNFKKIP